MAFRKGQRFKRSVLTGRLAESPSMFCGNTSTEKRIKGKSVPLQAWSDPEGSRMLRFPDFMTTEQDGGKVVSLKYRPPLSPGNAPGAHFC